MDSYEWNKIIGWILAAGIAVLGLTIVTGYVYPTHAPEHKGYIVEGVELESEGAVEGPKELPFAAYLAKMNLAKGEAQFKKCAACHTISQGGPNNQGPNLYGIVGANVAHAAGFAYSEAVKTHGGTWTFDELNGWLASPRKHIPGNKMSFAGISKPEDRADIIAYLNSQSASPLPLPAAPAIAEDDEQAEPAETAAAETAAPKAEAAAH